MTSPRHAPNGARGEVNCIFQKAYLRRKSLPPRGNATDVGPVWYRVCNQGSAWSAARSAGQIRRKGPLVTRGIAIAAGLAALLFVACRRDPAPVPQPPPAAVEAPARAWPDPAAPEPSAAPVPSDSTTAGQPVAAGQPPAAGEPATNAEPATPPAAPPRVLPRDVTPPSAPENLVAEATSEHAVALRWSASRDDVGVTGYQVLRAEATVATVKGTRAGEESLRPGTSYCYTVRALDAARNVSPAAGPVCVSTPDLTPPTAPAQLSAAAPGETEVELRWTAATDEVGVAGYEVLREGRVVAGGPTLTAKERGLRAFTEYCYVVRAFDGAGNRSGESPSACVRTPDLTPPSTPLHLVASATSDRSIQVLWQASMDNVGVEKYELLREGDVVDQPTGAWGEERDLHPGVRYCYAVRAVDVAGNRSPRSAVACALTPDVTPPTVPDGVAAQPVTDTEMFVTWEPSTDDVAVTGYEIVRDGDVTTKVSTSDAVARAITGGKHCFRVRALDAAGNRSALSNAICATTAEPGLPPAPFRLRAEAASERSVRLSWQSSAEPGMVYRVYWESGKNIGATRVTSFAAIGLKPGEHHCYRVAAVDENGDESPRTLEACAASRTESLSAR
jgi:chitodextrinase